MVNVLVENLYKPLPLWGITYVDNSVDIVDNL